MLEHSQDNYGREPAQPPPVLSNINVSVTGRCHASSMLHPDTQSHLAAERRIILNSGHCFDRTESKYMMRSAPLKVLKIPLIAKANPFIIRRQRRSSNILSDRLATHDGTHVTTADVRLKYENFPYYKHYKQYKVTENISVEFIIFQIFVTIRKHQEFKSGL